MSGLDSRAGGLVDGRAVVRTIGTHGASSAMQLANNSAVGGLALLSRGLQHGLRSRRCFRQRPGPVQPDG